VLPGHATGEVHRGDVLVHGVGQHVLVEEPRCPAIEPEPPQALGIPPVRDRGGHLEQSQVADDRAEPPAL
jgi:hypothetical protein